MLAESAMEPRYADVLVAHADMNPLPPNLIGSSSLSERGEEVSVGCGMYSFSPMIAKMNLTMPMSSFRAAAQVFTAQPVS